MAEISVTDLLAWEPRLVLLEQPEVYVNPSDLQRALEHDVSWAVTIRASVPMLPPMRGGEVVVVPDRVLIDTGVTQAELLREIVSRGAAAIVMESAPAVPVETPVLLVNQLPSDFDSELNRLVTEQRGAMYRAGMEIGRTMDQASATSAGVAGAIQAAASFLQQPVALTDRQGNHLAVSDPASIPPHLDPATIRTNRGMVGEWYGIRLPQGERLWFGAVSPDRRALTRLVAERVAAAVETALSHAAEVRPRGTARSMALAALLAGSQDDALRAAAAIGLHGSAIYRVAVTAGDFPPGTLVRTLAPAGLLHDAGSLEGREAVVLEFGGESIRLAGIKIAGQTGSIAISAAVTGPAALPAAARQSRYVAGLLESAVLPGRIAVFDQPADLGIYRLLYPLWGSPELQRFSQETLQALARQDRRGVLRQTLLAWLEAGGSQIEAAERLGIHRNTLAYRMRQITALTGLDPADVSNRLAIHMALVAESLPEG